VIKIIAVLCSLFSPANCHEQTVTTSDFADVSMQSCLMGAPQLAEWMKQHPAERLAAWLRVESSFPRGSSRPIRSVSSSIPIVRATLRKRQRTRRSTVRPPKARSRSIFRDTVCSPPISEVVAFQHLRCLRKPGLA